MTRYVALLRAVNVGGTGRLPMADLRALAEQAGLARVQTYIASGNLVFDSPDTEAAVKLALQAALQAHAGKPVDVLVRTAAEIEGVLRANPFHAASSDRVVAIFLDDSPPASALTEATGVLARTSRWASVRSTSTILKAWAARSSGFQPPAAARRAI